MKKYILNGIELTQGEGEDYEDLYYSDELDEPISEQDLIKLGATLIDDEWIGVGEMHVGGTYDMTWMQAVDNTRRVLNKLIKNQQHLKRRLDERL